MTSNIAPGWENDPWVTGEEVPEVAEETDELDMDDNSDDLPENHYSFSIDEQEEYEASKGIK